MWLDHLFRRSNKTADGADLSKHEEIADTLATEILAGQYRPGERLPSERDLAGRFGANRGAVREAMSKLSQLGLATIQPGGTRANALTDASLDVIGYMLARDTTPNAQLIDQIMQVINALLTTAAENVLQNASDDQIAEIRSLIRPLLADHMDEAEHFLARTALFRELMLASNNLICQLIARTLFEQFAPRMADFHDYVHIDQTIYRTFAEELDAALSNRDVTSVGRIFNTISQLNRQSVLRALADAELDTNNIQVATS